MKKQLGPAIYMFRVKSTSNMKRGVYFTLADIPSNALVQVYYAADKKNPAIIQAFAKDSGFTSVKAMCEDMKRGALLIPEIAKHVSKDGIIAFAMVAPETFDNAMDFKGEVIRGLLPIEPDDFFDWYETKLK